MHDNLILTALGHVDCGKTTLLGCLLCELGGIDRHIIEARAGYQSALSCVQLAAKNHALAGLGPAGVGNALAPADILAVNARRLVYLFALMWTSSVDSTQKPPYYFDTRNHTILARDCCGYHLEYLKALITGVYASEIVVLVLSAAPGEGEAGLARRGGATIEQAMIAKLFGINHLIVCINKMDTVAWSQERYLELVAEVSKKLTKIGWDVSKIPFIPCSAQEAINITAKPPPCDGLKQPIPSWVSSFPTLLDVLDEIPIASESLIDLQQLRISVQTVTRKDQQSQQTNANKVQIEGTIASGVLRRADHLWSAFSQREAIVDDIQVHSVSVEVAHRNDQVTLSLSPISLGAPALPPLAFLRGNSALIGKTTATPPPLIHSFVAQLLVLGDPSALKPGYSPVIRSELGTACCVFNRILGKLDIRSKALIEDNPQSLCQGDCILVQLLPSKPIYVECFSDFPSLSRVICNDMRTPVAIGIVEQVNGWRWTPQFHKKMPLGLQKVVKAVLMLQKRPDALFNVLPKFVIMEIFSHLSGLDWWS